MLPTYIGLIQLVVGVLLLFRGSVPAMLMFTMLSGLMNGSAALSLPALGGSSVPPIQFAAGFMFLRLIPEMRRGQFHAGRALRAVAPFAVFVLYGVLTALIAPRLFAHAMNVTPMRFTFAGLHARNIEYYVHYAAPLGPSPQNLTTTVYMVGGLILAWATYVATGYPRARESIVTAAVAVGSLHVMFGLLGLVAKGTPAELILDLLRNANYAQLDQDAGGFARVTGISPEPSAYAGYGFIWFVFLAECALRGVRPRATGPVAVALLLMLAISTSTTAYIGLAAYGTVLALRMVLVPGSVSAPAILVLSIMALLAITLGLGLYLFEPAIAKQVSDLFRVFTVGKSGSISAQQRSFWAKQGLDAFVTSYGIGIGPGSFRSSSLSTAIIGSTGAVGTLAFILLMLRVLKPLRPSTYLARRPDPRATGVAAAWAAAMLTVTASVSSPTPDPGPDFAILIGVALALRRRPTAFKPQAQVLGAPEQATAFTVHPVPVLALSVRDGVSS